MSALRGCGIACGALRLKWSEARILQKAVARVVRQHLRFGKAEAVALEQTALVAACIGEVLPPRHIAHSGVGHNAGVLGPTARIGQVDGGFSLC